MEKKTKKTVLLLLAISLCATVFSISCKKDSVTQTSDGLSVSSISFTPCHGSYDKGYYNPDSVAVRCDGKTLFVTHFNLGVNCGWRDIDVRCRLSNDSVYIEELEVTPLQANCFCETDNSFQINGLAPGTYTLVFKQSRPTIYQSVTL